MPGTTIKDAAATQLLDGTAITADIALGTSDIAIPHPGRCTAVLTVGTVAGTDPACVVTIGAGDGTNWAVVGTIALTDAESDSVLSCEIDDGGNGPYMTVGVEVGSSATDASFPLTLELQPQHHDKSPLMALGSAVHTSPTPTGGTPFDITD